jgi:hypothetical protein
MIFYACKADGTSIGQFDESDFREKIRGGELQPDHYYWREGMTDWKPISEYRSPGKVTTIIGNLPTGKTTRAAASFRARNTPLKKLKRLFRADHTKK